VATGLQSMMAELDQAVAALPEDRREQLVQLFALILRQGKGAEETLSPAVQEALSRLLGWCARNIWRGLPKIGDMLKAALASHMPTAVALLAKIEEARRG
jgi:hypothetical protein